MGWLFFGRKKQAKPLVPGRDRSSGGPRRPAYSYYSTRPASPQARVARPEGRVSTNSQKRRGFRFSFGTFVFVVCTLLALFSLGKILMASPQSKIVVSEQTEAYAVSDESIEAYRSAADALLQESPLNRFKLTLDNKGIAASLKQQFPELESVVVTLPILGNRPVIYVAPTPPTFTLETPAGFYSLDKNGYVLAKLPSQDTNLILLKDTSNRSPKPGEQYLATSITGFAFTVAYQLQQADVGTLAYLDLPVSAPYELVAHLSDKQYYIRFNLRADALQQSGAAIATLEQLGENAPSQYLDVRTPERAYYR